METAKQASLHLGIRHKPYHAYPQFAGAFASYVRHTGDTADDKSDGVPNTDLAGGGGLVRFTSPFLGPGSTRNICSSGASAHVAVGIKAICRHIQQSLSGRQLFGFLGLPSQLPVASLDEVVKELDPLFSLCP